MSKLVIIPIILTILLWSGTGYLMNTHPIVVEVLPLWIRIGLPISASTMFILGLIIAEKNIKVDGSKGR